jgi:hypothetical protein
MKFISLLILLFLTVNCSKPKTVLICGDHICINKNEAKQYFEENLTIQVKILDKKVKDEINLVELNLKTNQQGKKEVRLLPKELPDKNLKKLSNEEITQIKKKIKNKKKNNKITKKIVLNNEKISNKSKIKKKSQIKARKKIDKNFDVCTILEKCSIDEISKYLIKIGKEKNYPDITTRQ